MQENEIKELLTFIKSKTKQGEYLDIERHLSGLGFKDYEPMISYINELQALGYIRLNPEKRYSQYLVNRQLGLEEEQRGSRDYAIEVLVTAQGSQYLIENQRIGVSLETAKKAAQASWLSGIVAVITVIIGAWQLVNDNDQNRRLSKQDSIISSVTLKLAVLSAERASLSAALKEMKSLRQNTSKPEAEKK